MGLDESPPKLFAQTVEKVVVHVSVLMLPSVAEIQREKKVIVGSQNTL